MIWRQRHASEATVRGTVNTATHVMPDKLNDHTRAKGASATGKFIGHCSDVSVRRKRAKTTESDRPGAPRIKARGAGRQRSEKC